MAEVDLGILAANFSAISRKVGPGVKVMAVVKANAYGHGIREVATFLESCGAGYFGVATAEEGVLLRQSGIRSPIQVCTIPTKSQVPLCFDFSLEPTICTESAITLLESEGRRRRRSLPVHLKIDTGMNRIGAKVSELKSLLGIVGKSRRLELKGAYTHFATADETDKTFLRKQLDEFDRALEVLEAQGAHVELAHCANSGASLDEPRSYKSMVRPGAMLYGYYPSLSNSKSVRVKRALTLRSELSMVKRIEAGETVSYGRRFVATRPTWEAGEAEPAGAAAQEREPDPEPAPVETTVVGPAGTKIRLRLLEGVSSQTAAVGQAVDAEVGAPLAAEGVTAIPAGARVHGRVTEAHALKKVGGRARLALAFDSVVVAGRTVPIEAAFAREGKSETGKDAATIAAGAVVGTVLGNQSRHNDRGKVIGGLLGAGVGTAIAASTECEKIELGPGAELELTRRADVPVRVRRWQSKPG